jgi:hypothetical protein
MDPANTRAGTNSTVTVPTTSAIITPVYIDLLPSSRFLALAGQNLQTAQPTAMLAVFPRVIGKGRFQMPILHTVADYTDQARDDGGPQ